MLIELIGRGIWRIVLELEGVPCSGVHLGELASRDRQAAIVVYGYGVGRVEASVLYNCFW